MRDKEKLVKEHRLIEATSKSYTGLEGKFGFILKHLGEPIITQTPSSYSFTEFPDVYDLPIEEEMPTVDMEQSSVEVGRIFSGLKYGVNLEIRYLKFGTILDIDSTPLMPVYKTAEKILDVNYNSKLVYREVEHNLELFTPVKIWENAVEQFYAVAKRKENKVGQKALVIQEKKLEQLGFLEKMRERWGI
jgi:hypothetical protein